MRQFSLVLLVVALAGCSKQPNLSKSVYIDPALLSLVPPDATLMIGANLDTLRKSQIYQDHFANEMTAQLDNFARQTGLDPRKDIWEVLVFSSRTSTVVMARGKFSIGELEPKLSEQGVQKTKFKGYTMYGDDRNAGVFLNSSTAIVSDALALRAILDRRDQASAPPPVLVKLAQEIPHGAQIWAVFQGNFIKLPFEEGSNLGNVNRILAGLESGYAFTNMAGGLDVTATGNGTSDKSAQEINDALRALLGLLRLNTRTEQKELFAIYDAVDIKQSAKTVKMTAHIKQDLVEQLLKSMLFNGRMSGGKK